MIDGTAKVVNPFDDSLIDEVTLFESEEIEQALDSAYQYFKQRKNWLKPYERVALLEKFITAIKENKEELALTATKEGGKPIRDTKIEIERAITAIITAIDTITQLTGREIPMGLSKASEHRMGYTYREPVGVVFAISAFNHPINLIIHHIIPAIATGCPVLIKPSLKTPLSCIKLVELLYEAGAPKALCQLILCDDVQTEKLVSDPRISFLSFTGNSKVGWYLRSKLAPGAQCILIHGGAAPVIVEEDADLNDVLPLIIRGGFYHAGQIGSSVQRVFVHSRIIKAVNKKLTELTQKLVVGSPCEENTQVGPLIDKISLRRIEYWVNQAKENGARCLTGGQPLNNNCFAPTLLLEPSADVKVSNEELFGPVICLYSYKDRNQAIEQANALPYCFQAAVMTQNINIAMDTIKKLNATSVMVNDHPAFHVDWMPYGGRRHSGTGVGGVVSTMHALTYEKMMMLRLDPSLK